MKTMTVRRIELHFVVLELGIDYQENDLVPDGITGGRCSRVSPKRVDEIAEANGYERWDVWGYSVPQSELDMRVGAKVVFTRRSVEEKS